MDISWVNITKMVDPNFQILGVEIYIYGLLIGLGVILGINFSEKLLGKINTGYWLTVSLGAIVGARTYHVLDNWEYYHDNLMQVLSISWGGIGIYGAIMGALIASWVYSRIAGIRFFQLLDRVALAAPLAQAIGRWGNLFNHEGFGPPTTLPWRVYIRPEMRPIQFSSDEYFHPLFIYESVLLLILFIVMYRLVVKKSYSQGKLTAIYLVGYGSIRFILEFGRLDTWNLGGVKIAHILSVISILLGFLFLLRKTLGKKSTK